MLISTVGQARAAMLALNNDIIAAATSVGSAYGSTDVFTPFGGNVITQLDGGDMVEQSAASLLNQLAATWLKVNSMIDGNDSDPLSDEQIAALQELQSEVIDDRKVVGQAISSVNWTFGDLAADVVAQTTNLASQAVASVKDALPAVPWLAIEIGLAGVGLVLVWAIYRRVSGR
jgi:hypothetical protein